MPSSACIFWLLQLQKIALAIAVNTFFATNLKHNWFFLLLFIWCAPAKMLIANYERIKWIREFACTIWYKWSMWNQVESPIIDSKWILLFNVMQTLFIKCIWKNGIKYIFFWFFRGFETKMMMLDRCKQSHWSNISGKFTLLFLNFYFHIWMSNSISLQV